MSSLEADVVKLESALRTYFQMMKRSQFWESVQQRADTSIDRPAAAILRVLSSNKNEVWRVQSLATMLGIEAPSITRKTQELERAGYLERVRNVDDKRAVDLAITAEGEALAERITHAQRELTSQALAGWDEIERSAFVELFEKFATKLSESTK